MADLLIAADADRVRRLGRAWGAMAKAADVQGALLTRVAANSGISTGTGPAGERLAAYVNSLQAAIATMTAAYRRAAGRAPLVAKAIEATKAAEHARDEAVDRLARANAALSSAEASHAAATATVATHRAAGAISILVGMNIAPSPAQLAAVAQAEHRLIQAGHQGDAAQWVLRNSEQRFEQAEHEQERRTRAFAAMCRAEAEAARRALPETPAPHAKAPQIGIVADGLAALASAAAGQALAIDRFAKGDSDAASGALEIAASWAERLERYGRAGAFAAPALDAAIEAFALPCAGQPNGRRVLDARGLAGAP
ncbi:MAG: hypothetical protein DLM57_15000 [Pseudonocardiales bacterium]|nr:MAG: hypothetical protein DLM57_15000 [Pseudonocardiales bacterium]